MKKFNYYFSSSSIQRFKNLVSEEETVWDILKKIPDLLQKLHTGAIDSEVPEGVFLENKESITIEEGVIFEPGALIKGPCFIAKGCKVGHGSYIRENTILLDGAVVGHCSEVKNSVFFPRAKAPHFNYVGDSLLGCDTNLGAGVKCANVRFDKKPITACLSGEKVLTGMEKFGLILGDGSQLGCNAVTAPGTLIGKGVLKRPCAYVNGFTPSREKD